MLQTVFNALALGSVYALMAVGIGLVFGVLRLVNFAYGQLIMAGAYALAIGSSHGWPEWVSVLTCFGVVIALSLLMELGLFRPLRGSSAATMLVATFAVAFLLQSIALLKFGSLVKTAAIFPGLFNPIAHGELETVRKITVVAIACAVVALVALTLLLGRTTIGLHMRAASQDFQTARALGVRANAVITVAVVLSGVLAAVVSVILVVQNPFVEPHFALRDTIIVLVGVVVGGIDRLWTATLGGFVIGVATSVFTDELSSAHSVYVDSFVFGLVILVLLVRPEGVFAPFRTRPMERA